MRYVVNMFCKNKWKKMLSKWKRSCLLWNRIHNQHCVSFLINVYYTSSKQRSKPKIVRKMSKFTYWHPTIACISKQCFKPCSDRNLKKYSQVLRENCRVRTRWICQGKCSSPYLTTTFIQFDYKVLALLNAEICLNTTF